jgi:hypothetical protein
MADQLTWIKSTYSGPNDNCVEVAGLPSGSRALRDSKAVAGPTMAVAGGEWQAFIAAVKGDRFEVA